MSRPDLPATVTLRPWRSLHELGPSGLVLGLDPATALVVDDLPPVLTRLAGELRGPVAPAEFAERAARQGVPAVDAWTLLTALHEAGELVDAGTQRRVAARRAAARVVVAGSGPITVAVVVGLARAGVGVRCRTGGLVAPADLGTGLVEADLGRPRLVAVAEAAARLVPAARVAGATSSDDRDLVVLADEAPEPDVVAELHVTGTAHLVAGLRDGTGVVGPLVLPGRTACLRCIDLHRSACEPSWPLLAAQVAGRRGTAAPDCVAATAALAAAQALAVLDGGAAPPATLEATLEFDPHAGTVARRPWRPDPGCPCGARPGRVVDHPRVTESEGSQSKA